MYAAVTIYKELKTTNIQGSVQNKIKSTNKIYKPDLIQDKFMASKGNTQHENHAAWYIPF